MSDDPAKPPRFPIVGALLCAACLGAAGYLWMRYSYCWEAAAPAMAANERSWVLRYVQFSPEDVKRNFKPSYDGTPLLRFREPVAGCRGEDTTVTVRLWPRGVASASRARGRLSAPRYFPRVNHHSGSADTFWDLNLRASRFHGASVAGLVVGAMGVFVFTVALRHWLGERRRFREEARA